MKPRIQTSPRSSAAVPSVAATLRPARRDLRRTASQMGELDPVTTELIRMRNARFQNCNY
ncbi:MAG: hypothetical protein KGQ66_11875 [Acidobacteriota bacterium]|nr:hypothetical protein [Acidobacteriota bacterium]